MGSPFAFGGQPTSFGGFGGDSSSPFFSNPQSQFGTNPWGQSQFGGSQFGGRQFGGFGGLSIYRMTIKIL